MIQTKIQPLVDIDNSRLEEQRVVMEQIIEAGHCPFCRENLQKYHKQEILKEGEYWLVTKNQWPYKHTKVHLLIIYKQHATNLTELDPKSGVELLEFVQWAQEKFQIPGGGWAMRFGDTNYSAGTVAHIHVQFIMPDIDHPEYEPVRIKIGKK